MSVNLHLSVVVSSYNPARAAAIKQAIQDVWTSEQLDDMSPVTETGEGPTRTISSHSDPDFPLIVSRAYEWVPEIRTRLTEVVHEANGGPCHVVLNDEDADGGEDEPEDEDD